MPGQQQPPPPPPTSQENSQFHQPAFIRRRGNVPITADLLLAVLAFFVPPFSVFVKQGLSPDLLINIILTLLGAFPGIIHAWYIILKYPDDGVPVVQDWVHRQNFIEQVPVGSGDGFTRIGSFGQNFVSGRGSSSAASGGYQQISDDPNGLESGVMPASYSSGPTNTSYYPQQQQQQHPSPSSNLQHQQQQQQPPVNYGTGSGSSSQPSGSSGHPPPYQGNGPPPGFIPGDNKIQYGSGI